jgi:hypothetical protein
MAWWGGGCAPKGHATARGALSDPFTLLVAPVSESEHGELVPAHSQPHLERDRTIHAGLDAVR